MSTGQSTDEKYMIFNQSSTELHHQSARSSNHVMQHVLYLGTSEITWHEVCFSNCLSIQLCLIQHTEVLCTL